MNVEKENTLRALGDKELFATNQWSCALGIHTWLKWGKPGLNKRGAWTFVEQYRQCGCCGKSQRRILSKD